MNESLTCLSLSEAHFTIRDERHFPLKMVESYLLGIANPASGKSEIL